MQQLSDEYTTCLSNCKSYYRTVQDKKDALPDLKAAAKHAAERYKSAQKAIETRSKIDDLKRELAWSHVKRKEDVSLTSEL